MPFEELGIDVVFAGSDELGVLDGLEVLSVIVLANVCLEADGEDDVLVVGEAD